MASHDYASLSFWHDSLPSPIEPRAALSSDEAVDVAIVGAGYTGLWTAYYLKEKQPDLRIAIVEAEVAGFGASGRNGGWCVGSMAGLGTHAAEPAARLQRAIFDTVAEVGSVAARESIDCHWAHGGWVSLATAAPHRADLQAEVEHWREQGFGEDDVRWLDEEECRARVATQHNLGGFFSPHCATMHPARLARGLADVVEAKGVSIYEGSPAIELGEGRARTPGGSLRADIVVRAAEAYTATISGHERMLLPMHSMMIATEPLSEEVWKEIGLANREAFGDPRRMVTYGQRTADGRLAFGCRGAYYFGSRIHDRFAPDSPAYRVVEETAEAFFPILREARITHRWGGALGVPRDWRPRVGLDRDRGFAWAGGYVGEGVAASNLAGRTLSDLILERDSDLAALPLVGPPFRPWEPEPLRWLGVTAVRLLGESLDAAELRGEPTPRLRGALFGAFVEK